MLIDRANPELNASRPNFATRASFRVDSAPMRREDAAAPAVPSLQFFLAAISNPNTRLAYKRDASRFLNWCVATGRDPMRVAPNDITAYREELRAAVSPGTVDRHFAALRALYCYWVEMDCLVSNPVRNIRMDKLCLAKLNLPALNPGDVGAFFDSFKVESVVGLRDRALVGVLARDFVRGTTVVKLKVGDYEPRDDGPILRLEERAGKPPELPVPPKLAQYLDTYLTTAGIAAEKDTPLFRSAVSHNGQFVLTDRPLRRADAYEIVRRRAKNANIRGIHSYHSLRLTSVAAFLEE